MSQSIKTHLTTICDSLEALGYKWTKEVFDFDSVPASVMDKAYRVIVNTDGVIEQVGRVEKMKGLEIWLAYKFTATPTRAKYLNIVDSQDTVEDDILTAVSGFPTEIKSLDTEQAFEGNYIVFQVSVSFTYWRDVNG